MREFPFRAIGGVTAIGDGENVSILGLLLAAQSGRNKLQLLIDAIYLMSASQAGVAGVGIFINLRRITVLTSGTAGAVRLMEPNREAQEIITNSLTCVTGGTTGGPATFAHRLVNNDEISLTGQADIVERCIWKPAAIEGGGRERNSGGPLVITPGSVAAGVDIFQVTDSTTGAWIPEIAGRIRVG